MQKSLSSNIPVISLILSAVTACLLFPIKYSFPLIPFFILFTGLSTLVYFLRSKPSWFDSVLYLGILGLSAFLLVRANEFIQFLTFLSIFTFGSLLILPPTREHTLPTLLLTPLTALINAFIGNNHFPYKWHTVRKYTQSKTLHIHLFSVLVTFLFLLFTIPLLASANPFFDSLLRSVLNFFNLSGILDFFNSDQIYINFVRIFVFIILVIAIPRLLTISARGVKLGEFNFNLPVNYLIPKIAMAILLVVFFATQIQLYFASSEVLQSLGYTNSRLANEVFFQVTVVAFIIFLLAFLDKSRKTWHRLLTYILILQAFFLVGIAFKSVYDYSFLWGFTQKRLWGFTTMSWLVGVLLIFFHHYKYQTSLLRFFQYVITLTLAVILSVNFVNFDYLISHSSNARTQSGTDYVYLSKLSPDAHFYSETLENLMSQIEHSSIPEPEKVDAVGRLLGKIDRLRDQYSGKIQLNSFNFSNYQEYKRTKDLNILEYRSRLFRIEEKFRLQQLETPNQSVGPN